MKRKEFSELTTLYTDKYGDFTMGSVTFDMWWTKLKHLEADCAKEVFSQLLGSHNKPFGWKAVILVAGALFPQESEQSKQDEAWRKQKADPKDGEKRDRLNVAISSVTETNKRLINLSKPPIKWLKNFAELNVEVWGVEEAARICDEMQNKTVMRSNEEGIRVPVRIGMNSWQMSFVHYVREKIKNMKLAI